MKKSISILLCLVLAFCLAACGTAAPTAETNEIGKLAEEGYEAIMSTSENDKWLAIYQKDDTYLKVTADFPASAQEQYNALDMMADDYTEQTQAILYSLGNVETTDISDQVPSQEELDGYVGKTFADLEDEGYENTGYCGDEETGIYKFSFDGPEYSLSVGMQEGETIADMDDYSQNDIRALVIGSVSFVGFSFSYLNQ